MGQIQKTLPVKLVVSILTRHNDHFNIIEQILSKKFGPIDFNSPPVDFKHTPYYREELGNNLKRKFISFRKLIAPGALWKIKIFTNKIEDKFKIRGLRQFNLDPGYMNQAHLILASTKDFAHRIYLKNGIHGEVTLIFQNKTFQPLPWTYPDYQSKENIDIFIRIREILKGQLRNKR